MFITAGQLLEGDRIVGPVSGTLRMIDFIDVKGCVAHIWWDRSRLAQGPDLTLPLDRVVRIGD